jgi:hypothetical protein
VHATCNGINAFFDILVEINNNVIELNSAKKSMGSGSNHQIKTVIDVGSVANSTEPNSRYLFIEINHKLFCYLHRKEEDDTNIVLPESWEPSQCRWHQPGRAEMVHGCVV